MHAPTTRLSTVALTVLLALGTACGGAQKPTEPAPPAPAGAVSNEAPAAAPVLAVAEERFAPLPAEPVEQPESVLGMVVVPNLQEHVRAIGAYVDGFQPGAGAMLNVETIFPMFGLPAIQGVDLGQPIYAVVMDPQEVPGVAAIAVTVTNEGQLREMLAPAKLVIRVHEGFAVIGTRDAVEAAGPYLLTTVVREAPPAIPTLTFYAARTMRRYQAQVEAAIAAIKDAMASEPADQQAKLRPIIESYGEMLISAARQTELAIFELEPSAAEMSALMTLVPAAGSALAGFAAAQKPADYALLASLYSGAPIAFGTSVEFDALKAPLMDYTRAIISAMYGETTDELVGQLAQWFELLEGGMAGEMAMGPDGVAMSIAAEVTDGKKLQTVWNAYMLAFTKLKGAELAGFKFKWKKNAVRVGGVSFGEFSTSFTNQLPAAERAAMEKIWGTKGMILLGGASKRHMLMAMGKDAKRLAKNLLGRLDRPAGGLTGPLRESIADSVRRDESLLLHVDLAALGAAAKAIAQGTQAAAAPTPANVPAFTLGAGFGAGKLQLRFTLPAAQVAAMMSLGMP